jgi:hypothetical protein
MDDSIDCSSGDDSDTRETRARWRALAARVDRRGEEDRLSAQQALSSDSSTIPSARHATPITRDRSSSRTGQSTATLPDARHFASSLMASASISGGRAVRPAAWSTPNSGSPPSHRGDTPRSRRSPSSSGASSPPDSTSPRSGAATPDSVGSYSSQDDQASVRSGNDGSEGGASDDDAGVRKRA